MSKMSAKFAEEMMKTLTENALYVALLDANGRELEGEGYTRRMVLMEGGGGMLTNANALQWPMAGSNWGKAVYVALYTAATGGEMYVRERVNPTVDITEGTIYAIPESFMMIRFNEVDS